MSVMSRITQMSMMGVRCELEKGCEDLGVVVR